MYNTGNGEMVVQLKSLDEFKRQIEEALIEVDELKYSIEFDGDYMQQSTNLIEPLEAELKKLKVEVEAGTHQFGGPPLEFMAIIEPLPLAFIPFKYLLQVINHAHQHGVE
jgi:hypothetical protein